MYSHRPPEVLLDPPRPLKAVSRGTVRSTDSIFSTALPPLPKPPISSRFAPPYIHVRERRSRGSWSVMSLPTPLSRRRSHLVFRRRGDLSPSRLQSFRTTQYPKQVGQGTGQCEAVFREGFFSGYPCARSDVDEGTCRRRRDSSVVPLNSGLGVLRRPWNGSLPSRELHGRAGGPRGPSPGLVEDPKPAEGVPLQ